MLSIKLDYRAFEKMADRVNALHNQVPYALSRAMNNAAFETRKYLADVTWPSSGMTIRNTGFMKGALRVEPSRKDNLRVAIYDALGRGNLELHAKGGTKTARGKNLAIPTKSWVRYTSRGIDKAMLPRNLIANTPRRALRITNDGIYVGQGGKLHLLYRLKPTAQIKKKVNFYEDFQREMTARTTAEFPNAIADAMRTAK